MTPKKNDDESSRIERGSSNHQFNPVHSQTWTVCKGTIVGWIERGKEQETEGNVSFMLPAGSIIHAIPHPG